MDRHKRVDLATRIFAEHGSAIRSMIRQHVTCQEEEDEVYQNLYLSLVCNPPPEPLTNVTAYLNTVIRNDIIDAVRQRKSRQQMVTRYAMSRTRDEVEDAPDDRVTQAEEVQRIAGLVGKLLPVPRGPGGDRAVRVWSQHDRDRFAAAGQGADGVPLYLHRLAASVRPSRRRGVDDRPVTFL